MPDGSQQPVDPAAQRAQEQMREWKEKQHQGDGGGWWASIGNTIGDMMAAAEAGAFAVSPDTGAAIIKQLDAVKDQVSEMRRTGAFSSIGNLRMGGGYAADIARFNQQVRDETGPLLQNFMQELDQLSEAVRKSVAHYKGSDSGSQQSIDTSGGGL
ncbi:hypothetical protein JOF56_001666 [Kibdelosporangium banguiense]|uniref:WXG100 family type VII secretion target n=1 Tax=Kibdelosporangium banguiense TaxID=1365924 RepID=A0ABS4TBP9_9PSEU|nr:hypothetical protein [Kibdelosporangium banguiense]MBP2321281.1 hypothetical protein [Kibdelosporangium banguiense]